MLHQRQVVLATNNGDIGGGEVMMLSLARELEALGVPLRIVGPARPSAVLDAARKAGHATAVLPSRGRAGYMLALRQWRRRNPEGLLWCNGLVPSVATAGMPARIVHLHQIPTGFLAKLAWLARRRALITLVPSNFMGARVRGSRVMANWVARVNQRHSRPASNVIRLGFLGRPSLDKGVHILAAALQRAELAHPGRYRLVLAGEPRFVDKKARRAVDDALAPVEHLLERAGWLTPAAFFAKVDIMVCPSVWAEPFGLVVAEAMSARVPVIVSNAGALPEVVGPDHPWIVPAGNAEALAEMIGSLSDRLLHSAAGGPLDGLLSAAQGRWRECYSPEAGRERLASVLAELEYPVVAR